MQRTKILGRFLLMSSVVFGLSTIANWNEWNQYYNGTLRRVQTVDFNILSHILPAKLSSVLATKNYGELQKTLDSNYGLFGIVVTDCKKIDVLCQEQKTIFASNGRRDWRTLPPSDNLSNHPFDLLRTPLPLITEKSYKTSRSEERVSTKGRNEGIIIGRVYYVRAIPPDFKLDYTNWLSNVWKTNGAYGFYALKTGSFIGIGLAVWLSIEFLLYKKRVEQQQAIQDQERLKEELNIEINQNIELDTRNKSLTTQLEKSLNDLKHSTETYQQQIERLNTDIAQLTNSQSQQQTKIQAINQLLVIRQNELTVAQTDGTSTQEQLLHKECEITQLQQQMGGLASQIQEIISQRSVLEQNLGTISERFDDASEHIRNLEVQIDALSSERDRSLGEVEELRERLATATDIKVLTLVLKTAKLETVKMKRFHEKNIQFLESWHEELEKKNSELESERTALELDIYYLQLDIDDLEEQLRLSEEANNQANIPIVDLSSISIALVGGRKRTRQKVIRELLKRYNLKEIREVPTTKEKNADTKSVKEVVISSDIIAIVTDHIGHDLTKIISNLKAKGLQGEIIYLNSGGSSNMLGDLSIHLDRLDILRNLN